MAYTKNPQWKDYPDESTPVTAERLNHLEDGVYAAAATADNAVAGLSGKADTGHTHTAGDVSGLATVATSGSYDDLDDKPSIPSTPGDIGAAAASHQHAAGDITSGTIAPARLGTGTADYTKFLRGDGTWATPEGGGGGGSTGWRRYQPGRWYGATRMYDFHNGFAMAADVMDLTPLAVDVPTEIDRLAISVWTPGEAGSFMRVGVYATTHLWPTGAPLADVTLSLASTGTKQATVSLTLQPGFYWLAGVTSDTTARVRGYNTTGHVLMDIGHTAADTPRYKSDLLQAAGVSAAAPLPSSPEVTPRTMSSDALVITFRVAE